MLRTIRNIRTISNTLIRYTQMNHFVTKQTALLQTKPVYQFVRPIRHQNPNKTDSDSDSDTEQNDKIPKIKGLSDFWRRKMRTLHHLFDVNKDGVISFDDFQLLSNRFIALGNLTNEQQSQFQKLIKEIWENQWGPISPYNLVTAEQYLTDMQHVINDKTLRKRVDKFLPYLFQAVDKDASGEITITEFITFYKCLNISADCARMTFSVIDENNDGKLSLNEFVKLGRHFFFTDNENAISRLFWGPLIDH